MHCVAAAVAALSLGLPFQVLAFVIASVAGLGGVLRVAHAAREAPPLLGTRPAALVGKAGPECSKRSPSTAAGCASGGEEWSARSYDETQVIPVGRTVDVMQIEGAGARVYPGGSHGHRKIIIVAVIVPSSQLHRGPLGADHPAGTGAQRRAVRPSTARPLSRV